MISFFVPQFMLAIMFHIMAVNGCNSIIIIIRNFFTFAFGNEGENGWLLFSTLNEFFISELFLDLQLMKFPSLLLLAIETEIVDCFFFYAQ